MNLPFSRYIPVMKHHFNSPIGWLELKTATDALLAIRFLETKPRHAIQINDGISKRVVTELSEYFSGERTQFSVPLKPEGSRFQQEVWTELQQIAYGQTTTYGSLAKKLGDPNKVRAIGKANGQNPIPIIIPCHRVIGTDNNLVGYAGGIDRKRHLLKHEGAILL